MNVHEYCSAAQRECKSITDSLAHYGVPKMVIGEYINQFWDMAGYSWLAHCLVEGYEQAIIELYGEEGLKKITEQANGNIKELTTTNVELDLEKRDNIYVFPGVKWNGEKDEE